jgi:hypothetical protein
MIPEEEIGIDYATHPDWQRHYERGGITPHVPGYPYSSSRQRGQRPGDDGCDDANCQQERWDKQRELERLRRIANLQEGVISRQKARIKGLEWPNGRPDSDSKPGSDQGLGLIPT